MRQPVLRADALQHLTPIAAQSPALDRAFERRVRFARVARRATAWTLQLAALFALALLFSLRVPQVSGRSMEPRLHEGEHVLINILAYDVRLGGFDAIHLRAIRRGDIVAFPRAGSDGLRFYLKRVIGLPGERVGFDRGTVMIDGRPLAEPYPVMRDQITLAPRSIPSGTVFVLGDNRRESEDSRAFGPVPLPAISGRVLFVVWPPTRVGPVR